MYSSFQGLRKPETNIPIPPQMINFFNSTAPEGFEYLKDVHGEVCQLVSKQGNELMISGCKAKLTDRQAKMLGNGAATPSLIEKLLRNALEEVELDGSEAILHLAKEQRPFGCLIRTIDDNECATKARCVITKDPLHFEMPLTCRGKRIIMPFVQKPSGSIQIKRFVGEESALSIMMDANEDARSISYRFSFDNSREPDAKRCLDAAIILDGLRNGETEIEGFGKVVPKPQDFNKKTLAPFWRDVTELELALDIQFNASAQLDKETVANIYRLHRCICKGKAVGLGFKPRSITRNTIDNIPAYEGGICRLLFPEKIKLSVFGETITVHSNIGLSGVVLGKAEKIDGIYCRIPITYTDEFQCSILYLANKPQESSSEEEIERITRILFAPLPNGERY